MYVYYICCKLEINSFPLSLSLSMWNAVLYVGVGGGGGKNAIPENNITQIKEREIRQQIKKNTSNLMFI